MSTFDLDSEGVEEEATSRKSYANYINGGTSYYQQAEMHHSLREQSLGQFYRFQRHIVGGDTPVAQALNNTRHSHIILEELDSHGTGLDCLAGNKSFDIWDKWASPRLTKEKTLKGTTMRLYFRSLESFLKWVKEYKDPSEEEDAQEDSKLTENGLFLCRWSLGRPKTCLRRRFRSH